MIRYWTNNKLLLLLMVLILIVLSTGCINRATPESKKDNGNAREVASQMQANGDRGNRLVNKEIAEITIYFSTESELHLAPLTFSIPPTDQGAKAALQRLIVGPNDDFLKPVVNTSTKIRDIYVDVDKEVVYLDLTEHFLNFPIEDGGELAILSILKTIEPFIGKYQVMILVEGQVMDMDLGQFNLRGPLTLPLPEVAQGDKQIKLYFVEQNGMYLVPVTKVVATPDPVTASVIELVKGPGEASGLIPTIWPGTRVLGVKIEEDLVEVDLSIQAIGYGGGSAAENLFIKSILLTMTEFPQINQVQLLFEGEKLEHLPEGTEVNKPLSRPEHINYKI